MANLKQFPPPYKYTSLSVKDLVEARDVYHWHLSHLSNVTSTAIGLYRIRHGDWYEKNPPHTKPPKDYQKPTFARTVYNSVVTDWSFPCILVFVREWVDLEDFAKSPDQMVPRALFLPNGKVVPTCTILAEESEFSVEQKPILSFPQNYIGGGYLINTQDQGRNHFGSVGCLVTDGKVVYGLTNKHVTGEAGREVFAEFPNGSERIGVSDSRQLGKLPFTTVYTEWQSEITLLNADVGLIRIDDVNRWTTQILGFGSLDLPLDFTTQTLTLDVIDCPVSAFGGMSGKLAGKIVGLFYRYKSVGGKDYVADFLIAPRTENDQSTLRGDSGTLWCLEEPVRTEGATPAGESKSVNPTRFRPFAVQWGGHTVVEQNGDQKRAHTFALATNLSTICRELDLDVLRGWNSGLPEYWGAVGHYTIAAKAIDVINHQELKDLMTLNLERITYDASTINRDTGSGLVKAYFAPLADVPDMVWKMHKWEEGGRNPFKKHIDADPSLKNFRENPNHYADMDAPVPKAFTFQNIHVAKGQNLLDICRAHPEAVNVEFWQEYYRRVNDDAKGTLPFRVQQIYCAMVDFVANDEIDKYIFAAGVLAHFVGDACQPLHISRMHDGDPDRKVTMEVYDRKKKQWVIKDDQPYGSGIHGAYENSMIEFFIGGNTGILAGINNILANINPLDPIDSNNTAAMMVVELMQKTYDTIPPKEIIDVFAPLLPGDPPRKPNGSVPKAIAQELWNNFGKDTKKVMAVGCLYLAHFWNSAWEEGLARRAPAGVTIPADAYSEKEIRDLYNDQRLIPSVTLDEIDHYLC